MGKLSADDNEMSVAQTLKYFLDLFNPSFSVRHKLSYVNNIPMYMPWSARIDFAYYVVAGSELLTFIETLSGNTSSETSGSVAR